MPNPITEWQRELLGELGRRVSKYGFAAKPVGQSFRRYTKGGRDSFHVAFIEHGSSDFDVTADMAVRIDAVELLATSEDKLLTKLDREQTATLGCEIGNLTEGRPKRWSVRSGADVQVTAAGVADAFVAVALPYFEKYADLQTVYETLCANDRSGWLHAPLDDARCKRAISLAVVLEKHGDLPALIEKNGSYLREKEDAGLTAFLRLGEKLLATRGRSSSQRPQ